MIFILTGCILNIYGVLLTNNVKKIVQSSLRSKIYSCIFNIFDKDSVMSDKMMDVVKIEKNNNGEVLSVDYHFDDVYRYLNSSMNLLNNHINEIDLSDTYIKGKHGVFFVPSTMVSNNLLINELGVKIPIKVQLLKNVDMSFKTKVSNYGINNLLVELYLDITVMNEILLVGEDNYQEEHFSIVIAAKLITGKVPTYYGGTIEKSSSIVSS